MHQCFFPFYGWIVFHRMDVLHLFGCLSTDNIGLFPPFVNSCTSFCVGIVLISLGVKLLDHMVALIHIYFHFLCEETGESSEASHLRDSTLLDLNYWGHGPNMRWPHPAYCGPAWVHSWPTSELHQHRKKDKSLCDVSYCTVWGNLKYSLTPHHF